MSLDAISTSMDLPRSTVYYWIRDIAIERTNKQKAGQIAATTAMQSKFSAHRQVTYDTARATAATTLLDREIRDFVVLYLAEGNRKDRNRVAISNSNPNIVRFAYLAMRRLSTNPHFYYSFQFHADQDPETLRVFWATYLGIRQATIKPISKTNSGHLKGRRFACEYGVFQIQVGDTTFRSQLQALMDAIQEEWSGKVGSQDAQNRA